LYLATRKLAYFKAVACTPAYATFRSNILQQEQLHNYAMKSNKEETTFGEVMKETQLTCSR
jgi:hypothetical protein